MSKVKYYSEILNGRLCLVSLENGVKPQNDKDIAFFPALLETEVTFSSIPSYFGPPDMGQVVSYIAKLRKILQNCRYSHRIVVLFENVKERENLTNAAFLVGAFAILALKIPAAKVWLNLQSLSPGLVPFRDTSNTESASRLPLENCLMSLEKARTVCGLFDLDSFDLATYEHLQSPNGGDITWLVPGKFVAFPAPQRLSGGFYSVSRYIDYFLKNNIRTVVRCCEPNYDAKLFQQAGIAHHELIYKDCTAPTLKLTRAFLDIAERAGIVAIHCWAGLGRTGTLVAAFLIKHTDFSALEAVAWLRTVRPGSVIGKQQDFLQHQEKRLKKWGKR